MPWAFEPFAKKRGQRIFTVLCAFANLCAAMDLSRGASCLAFCSYHSCSRIQARFKSHSVEKFYSDVFTSWSIFVGSPLLLMSNSTNMCMRTHVVSCVWEYDSNKTVWRCLCLWCVLLLTIFVQLSQRYFSDCLEEQMCLSVIAYLCLFRSL